MISRSPVSRFCGSSRRKNEDALSGGMGGCTGLLGGGGGGVEGGGELGILHF